MLRAGRGLLMVDGLDERERGRVREWLRELLLVYPDNRWLATSRPSAVEDGWLAQEGFTELMPAPMHLAGPAKFVTRWHAAAAAGCRAPQEAERLPGYRDSLLTAIRTKPDLGRPATNPLMCGLMICALHCDRRGYLPYGRKELYESALTMLTADRDQRRDVSGTEGIELTAEPQIQLLQRLAYWLIRNGRSELSRGHAERIIAEALLSVPAAHAQGDAAAVFRHLLLRSGLLREPVGGTVDFVHRTFQDYLGAKRAVDKAADSQWEDVVRMAVAHARPRERADILRALPARPAQDEATRARVALLAMACLEHATEIEPGVREDVLRRAAQFVPPRDMVAARELARVGPLVLELLPGPQGCEADGVALPTVVTASLIPSDAAIPFLRQFADHPQIDVRKQLAYVWKRFNRQEYFREVISRLVADDLDLVASDLAELDLLIGAGLDARLQLHGDFERADLVERLSPQRLTALTLSDNLALDGLGFLTGYPRLTHLSLRECLGVEDCTVLRELPVTSMWYRPRAGNNILRHLPAHVTDLVLQYHEAPQALGDHRAPGVRSPRVDSNVRTDPAPWFATCFPGLTELAVDFRGLPGTIDAHALTGLPGLRSLLVNHGTVIFAKVLQDAGVRVRVTRDRP